MIFLIETLISLFHFLFSLKIALVISLTLSFTSSWTLFLFEKSPKKVSTFCQHSLSNSYQEFQQYIKENTQISEPYFTIHWPKCSSPIRFWDFLIISISGKNVLISSQSKGSIRDYSICLGLSWHAQTCPDLLQVPLVFLGVWLY